MQSNSKKTFYLIASPRLTWTPLSNRQWTTHWKWKYYSTNESCHTNPHPHFPSRQSQHHSSNSFPSPFPFTGLIYLVTSLSEGQAYYLSHS